MVVVAVALLAASCSGSGANPARLAMNTGFAPWPDPDHVPARVAAAGLPHSKTEYLTVHYHSHLDIFVNGRPEPVAASIGREDGNFFSPLHTHATSGLIHMEAARDLQFTLGMLFKEWGIRLTDDCIGGYCRPATPVSAYVNGTLDVESLPAVVLTRGQELALVIGVPPPTIPSSWDCRTNINPSIENPAQCRDFGQ